MPTDPTMSDIERKILDAAEQAWDEVARYAAGAKAGSGAHITALERYWQASEPAVRILMEHGTAALAREEGAVRWALLYAIEHTAFNPDLAVAEWRAAHPLTPTLPQPWHGHVGQAHGASHDQDDGQHRHNPHDVVDDPRVAGGELAQDPHGEPADARNQHDGQE